jgi:putative toxin-antitoxin system antitoxin component (TIGR02293 family)
LVRVADVLERAREVWENEQDAWDFLHAPHPLLGGERPIDRARTERGARQVADLLWKLDHGLPV